MKRFINLVTLVLLTSCTSAPLSVNYYLLHTPTPIASEAISKKTQIYFSSLSIADYLHQKSLVIQISQHELHFSRQDLWAEDLKQSFYKALKHDLNLSSGNQYGSTSPFSENELILKVNLEHFNITNEASVISSGTYRIQDNNKWLDKPFYVSAPLLKNGYPHAVTQLRSTIETLAKQINADINQYQQINTDNEP
ncbi:membrane integrity-associated transporter subunit PqiC [Paraglaciecola sp. 2405UD69-4]|uniref:PqiC family protein n=1 Tax=Paraglaciecola sp. 2405UD69-4 TaxID=3391836 RepID=UPI0039C9EFEC